MRERDSSLDAVKGLAIWLVMLGHCLVWNNLSATDPYCYDFIKAVQMPLFMMVSGYLAGMGMKRRTLPETGKLIAKRAAAYLIPFFVWPVLLHPLHPIAQIREILWQFDKGLWFLGTLFLVMTITMLAQWLSFLTCTGVFPAVLFFCYILLFWQSRSGNTFLSPALTLTYLPYYVTGYLWTAYVKRLGWWKGSERINRTLWGIAAVLFLGLIVLCDLQKTEGLRDIAIQFAAGITGSFVCFYGIYGLRECRLKKWLAGIGTVTLELYVFQYAMHAAFVRFRGLGDTQYSLYCTEGVLTVLCTFFVMCAVSAAGVFVFQKVPVLDALLLGHIRRIKGKQ